MIKDISSDTRMRCVNFDEINSMRFYARVIFEAIIRNWKNTTHPVNNVH